MKWSWRRSRVVCQALVWRVPKATTVPLTPLLPPTSFSYLLASSYLSTSLLKTRPSNSFFSHHEKLMPTCLTCVPALLLFPSCISSPRSQIMVLTDPEFESSVLISSDEGASYQKYRLTFYVLSLLFHPTEEDWALAYSHDQKVRFCLMSSPLLFLMQLVTCTLESSPALCYSI